jgi:soluble lytic murein transglycosylase-like protein
MRIFHLIGLCGLASLALPIQAGEYAVLGNGFRLHADRHEVDGDTIRLYAGGGVSEMPSASIVRFEAEEEVAVQKSENMTRLPPRVPEETAVPATPMELAAAAAEKYSLPASFVASVMRAESGFQPSAVSPKGAIGLMQLMPETARQLGVDPADPKQNAEGGAQYLHDLLAKYEKDPDQVVLALAAYNAGPGAVEKYHGVPPYRETREYILRVLKNYLGK